METKFIEELFFKQIQNLTTRTATKSYNYQFSDGWVQKQEKNTYNTTRTRGY
jgi:hypothetical protein